MIWTLAVVVGGVVMADESFAFSQRLPQIDISPVSSSSGSSTPKAPRTPSPVVATPPVTATPSTPTPAVGSTDFVALWHGKNADADRWSDIVRNVVQTKAPALMKGSSDIEDFCPMYSRLGTIDQLNFWVQFFAAVSKYESGFDPTSRMVETTMGTDPMTGKQVASEGLLQLSYQDETGWSFCDFDYQTDKQYAINDIRRSILNPEKNLSCGIQILNNQVAKRGAIALSSNVYWAVLKIGGKYTQLPAIKSITNKLSFCQR